MVNTTPIKPLPTSPGHGAQRSSKASLGIQQDVKPKRRRTKAGCITCRVRGKVSLTRLSVFSMSARCMCFAGANNQDIDGLLLTLSPPTRNVMKLEMTTVYAKLALD